MFTSNHWLLSQQNNYKSTTTLDKRQKRFPILMETSWDPVRDLIARILFSRGVKEVQQVTVWKYEIFIHMSKLLRPPI